MTLSRLGFYSSPARPVAARASATACMDSGESSETWIAVARQCTPLRERRRRRTWRL